MTLELDLQRVETLDLRTLRPSIVFSSARNRRTTVYVVQERGVYEDDEWHTDVTVDVVNVTSGDIRLEVRSA